MRHNIKGILANPAARRRMMINCIIAIQAREGIITTVEQASRAYDMIQMEARK